MKGLFAFQAEPFEFEAYGGSESEFTFRPEPFPWPPESEWEGEASRSSPDYIRWLQSSLNRVMGLRLAVDGILGPATRSAVRNFQQRQGLIVDGIVGPQTEAKLRTLTGTRSLGSAPVSGSVPVSASFAPPSLPSPCGSPALLPCPKPAPIDHFAEAKAVAEPGYQTNYDAAIKGLATCIGAKLRGFLAYGVIRIIGHTSAEGSPESNKALAQARADQVSKDLESALLSQGLAVATLYVVPIDGVVILQAGSAGETSLRINPERNENDRKLNRRVEIDLSGLFRKPPGPAPAPVTIDTLIKMVRETLGSLPLSKAGVVLPTTARFLDPAEQAEARKVYGNSLDFTKILITDGLGASGRKFTLAVNLASGGWHVVIMMGDVLCWANPTPCGPSTTCCWRSVDLIHELAHAWQSQHHGPDPTLPSFVKGPTAFMWNSVKCQGKAEALTAASKLSGANKRYDAYAYTNPPGNLGFDKYQSEQIAQQVQHHYQDMLFGKNMPHNCRPRNPNAIVLTTIRSPAPNAPVPENVASLKVVWAHELGAPGVFR